LRYCQSENWTLQPHWTIPPNLL